MEMEMEISPERKKETEIKRFQLANRVYFFVEGFTKGIMIYDQSPTGLEAELFGALPEGKYHASGMEVVEWDDLKNNSRGEPVVSKSAYSSLLVETTVIVDEATFLQIALQGINPEHAKAENRKHYIVVDLNDQQRDIRKEIILTSAKAEELDANQRALYQVAITNCRNHIIDLVNNNNKEKNNK